MFKTTDRSENAKNAKIKKFGENRKSGRLLQPTAENFVPELHCIGFAVARYVWQLGGNVQSENARGFCVCAQKATANKGC